MVIIKIGRVNECMPVVETDGGRNQSSLLAQLVIIYSGTIGAWGTFAFAPPLTSRLQLQQSVAHGKRILGASPRTKNDLHHKMLDHRGKRVTYLVMRSLGHCTSHA